MSSVSIIGLGGMARAIAARSMPGTWRWRAGWKGRAR